MTRKRIDLSCPDCGSNRLRIPSSDDEMVTCEDCGADVQSLRATKELLAGAVVQTAGQRAAVRRLRHTAEIEASQADLRKSIAETDRLVSESDKMLRRHHKECDDDIA